MARASPALTAKARPAKWRNGLSNKHQRRLEAELTLRVLLSLAGLLETGLLALDDASVAAQVTGLLQGGAVVLGVDLVQRTGDAEAQGTGLAGDAATVDAGNDVVGAVKIEDLEGLVDVLLVQLVREVVRQLATVDGPLAGAGHDANACNSFLATANCSAGNGQCRAFLLGRFCFCRTALRGVAGQVFLSHDSLGGLFVLSHDSPCIDKLFGGQDYWATWVISKVLGCWAACGCSAPRYTFSLPSCWAAREFLGSMPLMAFSTARTGLVSSSSA